MRMKIRAALFIVAALAATGGLWALWHWALFGMAESVATAWIATTTMVPTVTIAIAMVPGIWDDDQ